MASMLGEIIAEVTKYLCLIEIREYTVLQTTEYLQTAADLFVKKKPVR